MLIRVFLESIVGRVLEFDTVLVLVVLQMSRSSTSFVIPVSSTSFWSKCCGLCDFVVLCLDLTLLAAVEAVVVFFFLMFDLAIQDCFCC